jgi:hypothetical protein
LFPDRLQLVQLGFLLRHEGAFGFLLLQFGDARLEAGVHLLAPGLGFSRGEFLGTLRPLLKALTRLCVPHLLLTVGPDGGLPFLRRQVLEPLLELLRNSFIRR